MIEKRNNFVVYKYDQLDYVIPRLLRMKHSKKSAH